MTENKNNKPQLDNNEPANPNSQSSANTDPQEKMEGPFSSMMHKTGEAFETNETKEEAEEEKDENM